MLGAQVFYVDPQVVLNASQVGLTAIDLYFQSVPSANNNMSGIANPGVTVYIVPVSDGVPVLDSMTVSPWGRLSYNNIIPSLDASVATTVYFNPPVQVSTGYQWAFVVIPDGDENFVLWENATGDPLVGTSNTLSTGATGTDVGNLFEPISAVPLANNNNQTGNSTLSTQGNTTSNSAYPNSAYTSLSWTPLVGTDLKFTVYAARYSINGNNNLIAYVNNSFPNVAYITLNGMQTVTNNISGEATYTLPVIRTEYFTYYGPASSNIGVQAGERLYQNTVFYSNGGLGTNSQGYAQVAVTAQTSLITAVSNSVNFNTLLNLGGTDPEFIVITSKNANGPNADVVAVRQVTGLISNSQIMVDEPIPFSNSNAWFFRSPVAQVWQWDSGNLFGINEYMLIAIYSTANTTMRFVNNSIIACNANAIGSGYSNTDQVQFLGYEVVSGIVIGGYAATANITTFGNGSISNIFFSNIGCGFINVGNITANVINSTGHVSVGTGATWNYTIGSCVKGELLGLTGTGGYFNNVVPINLEVGEIIPGVIVSNPSGTVYSMQHRLVYYSNLASTFLGKGYYCDLDAGADFYPVQTGVTEYPFQLTKTRCLMSWSQEVVTPFANGSSCNGAGGSTFNTPSGALTSNSSVLYVNAISNNDFTAVGVAGGVSTLTFERYIINDSYYNETLPQSGNAWARGIEVQYNLANTAFAEDMIVYLTLYQPPDTQVLVYSKIWNSQDADGFSAKDWTQLAITQGNNLFSSSSNVENYVQLTYTLYPYPQNTTPLVGYAVTSNNSATVSGVGTLWHTNATVNLVSGDLVLLQQPLFPNNYAVAMVNVVANDTSFTINYPIVNNNLEGSGLTVALINTPHQAFHEYLNSNIVAYYNTEMVKYSTYDSAQLKIVMLSSNNLIVPFIANLQAVSCSI